VGGAIQELSHYMDKWKWGQPPLIQGGVLPGKYSNTFLGSTEKTKTAIKRLSFSAVDIKGGFQNWHVVKIS
jgi:hypothetical protein